MALVLKVTEGEQDVYCVLNFLHPGLDALHTRRIPRSNQRTHRYKPEIIQVFIQILQILHTSSKNTSMN